MIRPSVAATATALVLLWSAPVPADMAEDCNQGADPDRRISGCTAIIDSGQWSGADLARAYNNLGVAYTDLGDHGRAIEEHQRALAANALSAEDAAHVRHYLAFSLYHEKRAAEGLAHIDQALSSLTYDASAVGTRAHILAELGRPDEALAEFDRALRIGDAGFVRTYQASLARQGFDPGPVDGSYGPATFAALEACLQDGCRIVD